MNTIDKTSELLTQHQRLDIGHCLCGWGVDTGQLGKSHSRHVAGLLFEAELLANDKDLLAEVRNLHRSWDIYDDCGHRHELNEDGSLPDDVKNIPEVGYVCHEGFMYSICRECCTDGEFQTEECATYHNHHQPGPRCRTNAILEGDS